MMAKNLLKVDFQDLARVSVFSGVVRLAQLRETYEHVPDSDLIHAATAGSACFSASDIKTASQLIGFLRLPTIVDDRESMRLFLTELLAYDQPPWVLAAVRGRRAVRAAMPAATIQCFDHAGLFDAIPDNAAVKWWDTLARKVRGDADDQRKMVGREGERLSFEYEVRRLASLGITAMPRWSAMEDEWLGYDLLSYDLLANGNLANRLIEVKSCSALPLEIYLTRNEWDHAVEAKQTYHFHVWHLPTKTLFEVKHEDLQDHVPVDQGKGIWGEVRVRLPSAITSVTALQSVKFEATNTRHCSFAAPI